MSRHRIVRSMNYSDEYDGYDDVYGHSVEEDFSISPSDAEQFIFDRNKPTRLSLFRDEDQFIPEEDENLESEENCRKSSDFKWPELNPTDEVRLRSCLEEIRNVIGDAFSEATIIETILKNDFDFAKSLDTILTNSKDAKQVHHKTPPEINDLKQYLKFSQTSKLNLGNSTEKQFEIPNLQFNLQNNKLNSCSDSDEEDNGFSSFMALRDKYKKSNSPSTNSKPNSEMKSDFDNIAQSINVLTLPNKNESSNNITSLSDLVTSHLNTKKQNDEEKFSHDLNPLCETQIETLDSTDTFFIPNLTLHTDNQHKIESQDTFSEQNKMKNTSKWTIDLSSALNNSIYKSELNKSAQKIENIEKSTFPKQGISDNLDISFIDNSQNSQNNYCSSLGKVLCKKWEYSKVKIKRKNMFQYKYRFNFDTPSPDDRRNRKK